MNFIIGYLWNDDKENVIYTNRRSITPPKPVEYTEYSFVPKSEKFETNPVQFNTEYNFNSGEKFDIKRPKPKSRYNYQPPPKYSRPKPPHPRRYTYYEKSQYIPPPRYTYYEKPQYIPPPRYTYYEKPQYNSYSYTVEKTDRQKAFEILEISENSNEKTIKKAYHKLALKFHPDKNDSSSAEEMFKKISDAYEFIKTS